MLSYLKEADFLFRRFNSFLLAMSFLVTAFALTISATRDVDWLGYSLASVGCFLSFLFVIFNWFNSRNIKKMRDYAFRSEIGLAIVSAESVYIKGLGPPLHTTWSELDPDKTSLKWCKKAIRDYPAFHTWFIPFLFILFWAAMIGLLSCKCL